MGQNVLMPKLGQTVEESTIVRWLKNEGDRIAKGETIFEIETDKAVLEVESFYDGTLLRIYVEEGRAVPVQSVVAYVGEPGESAPEPPAVAAAKPKPKPAAAAKPSPVPGSVSAPPATTASSVTAAPPAVAVAATPGPTRFKISPRARRLARERVIDPTPIRGTGSGGRVVERDVWAYLEARGYDRIRVTPTAKLLAAKEGLNLLDIRGTGVSGRITVADIERAVAEKPKPMSKMRQTIARRLTQSFTTTPHFFVTVSVDVTDLLALRRELRKSEVRLSVTDFLLKAVALSLQEYPTVNSTSDGVNVQWHSHVNLGVAVALDAGLVVPVIPAAEELSLSEMHDLAGELIAKARDGKLRPDEMTGGTFTISNMGMLDVENFTAIINPGESAILAVSSIIETPAVRKGEVVVRSVVKMTLSADHRIVDGAVAARFINAIKVKLEDLELWKRLT